MSRKYGKRGGKSPAPGGSGQRVVFGLGPVTEMLSRQPGDIERLMIRSAPRGRLVELAAEAARCNVTVVSAEVADLTRVAGADANHQGVVALAGAYRYAELDDIIDRVAPGHPVVLLDSVTDPHNLGAICRSAHLLGAAGLVIGRDRSAPVNSVATKASAGATEYLPIAQVTNLARALEDLREADIWRAQIAAGPDARPLDEIDTSLRLALVLGSEGRGLRPLVARQTDFAFVIPMAAGGVGSFNVSVAASLALYEIARANR